MPAWKQNTTVHIYLSVRYYSALYGRQFLFSLQHAWHSLVKHVLGHLLFDTTPVEFDMVYLVTRVCISGPLNLLAMVWISIAACDGSLECIITVMQLSIVLSVYPTISSDQLLMINDQCLKFWPTAWLGWYLYLIDVDHQLVVCWTAWLHWGTNRSKEGHLFINSLVLYGG